MCTKYGQDKLRYAKDMARICSRCAQDMPNTLLIYAQDMLKIQIFPRYRVTHPSCHPQKPETRNKQSPELATPKKITGSPTLVSLEVASSGLCHFLVVASPRLHHFRGWPVQHSVFSGFWHIGKFGGGKKDGSPCMSQICPRNVLDMSRVCQKYVSTLEKDWMTWTSPGTRVALVSAQCWNQTTKQPTNHANIEPLQFFISFDRLGDPVNLEFGNLAICVSRTHCSAFSTNLPSGWFYQGHRWSLINKSVVLIKQIWGPT